MAATTILEKPESTPAIHLAIKRDRDGYLPEGESVVDYRAYVEGKHSVILTDKQQKILEGITKKKFCNNIARKIVTEARDRLTFMAWECENRQTKDWLDNLFKLSRIEERQSKIHFDSLRDANHALAISWDNEAGRVRIYSEPWWDGTEGIFIGYDELQNPVYAAKDWVVRIVNEEQIETGTAIRRIVYFADRFERWISLDTGSTWQPFSLPGSAEEGGDNGVWPQPWRDIDGNPLGIPYVHFKNSGTGEQTYGVSELAGGVLGLIDQIQDLDYVLSGAARVTGFPIIWGTGIALETDSVTGDEKEIEVIPGSFLTSPSPEARFGRIEPGDPTGILRTKTDKCQSIATMTQTPMHSITGGDWPSGEALMRAEQPAVGKANTQVSTFKNCWSSVAVMAARIWNRFSTGPKVEVDIETAMVQARFAPTERRDPLTKSIIVQNLGERISDEEALRIMGYTEQQIEQIQEEKKEKADQAAENAAVMFSRGVGPGTALPGRGAPPPAEETEE